VPILAVLEPGVSDTDGVRLAAASPVQIFEGDPIASYAEVVGDLNGGGLEVDEFEGKTLAGLRGNPVGGVIFADGS